MKAEWRNADIDVRSFESYWGERIEVTGNSNDTIFSTELYNLYHQYCAENNFDTIPYNNMKNWIAANVPLKECMPKRIHKTNENPRAGYVGIRFVD